MLTRTGVNTLFWNSVETALVIYQTDDGSIRAAPAWEITPAEVTSIPSANQNLTHQIRTAREKELFFEAP